MYGTLVAEARRSRGLTQVELAEVSGVEQSNISAIERGRREPSAATLHRLLHACGYELTATAGDTVLALPPPADDPLFASLLERSALDDPPAATRTASAAVRAQKVVAVLELAESIVRSSRQR